MSDTGGFLFGASALCAMGGWLPAVCGSWHLLVLALVCVCAGVWADLWGMARAADCAEPGARRPLRRIVEAEREALARHRRAP